MATQSWRSTAWRVTLLAALVLAIVIILLRGAMSGNDSTARASVIDLDYPYLTTNRDHLGICVQTTSTASLTADDARSRVSEALELVQQEEYWPDAFATGRVAVDAGCPTIGSLLSPDNPVKPSGKGFQGGEARVNLIVDSASPYLLYVFVLSDAELQALFGSVSNRAQAQEMLCDENRQCAQVTTGVYISDRELDDAAFLADWLSKGIGLVPAVAPANADPDAERTKLTPVVPGDIKPTEKAP